MRRERRTGWCSAFGLTGPRLLLGACLLALLFGCSRTPKPRILGEGRLVREVRFEGVERFSKGTVLEYLHLGETRWLPFSPDYPHDSALLAVDTRRLEELYHAHGYLEARVVEIVPSYERDRVDLFVRVEEGPVTRVHELTFQWAEDSALDPEAQAAVEAASPLKQGAAFEVPRFNDTLGNLRQELRQRGFPLARVTGRADVRRGAQQASVKVRLEPGPAATIRGVRFEGLVGVPEYMVQREVRFVLGEAFSPARLAQVEQAVKAMRVFRWVTVQPPTEVKEGQVELLVQVSEADPQSLRLGAELSFEATRWQEQLSAQYTHTNLFGHLTRLDLKAIAGWAHLPNPWDPVQQGPALSFVPAFTKKGILEDNLVWAFVPGWEMNVLEGYQYHSPSTRVGVSRWFFGSLSLSASHNLRYVDFFNLSEGFNQNASLLGRDFRDPFLLSYLALRARYFQVDSITHPTHGYVAELGADWAGGALFRGDYDFLRFTGELRAYWRPFQRLQLASQLVAGAIQTYGSRPGAPFNLKFYLGGANTLRGWGSRRGSPRIEECDEAGACSSIPVGGYTMLQANLEARFALAGGFALVAFFDAGDVQADEWAVNTSEWNYTAGPGLRFDSPVGLFRLDVGFRLNDPGVYPGEPTWALYFGLGETF